MFLTKSKAGLTNFIEYRGEKLWYSLLINRRLKNSYIYIDPEKGVIVKTPYANYEKIHAFLEQKAAWIYSKTKALEDKKILSKLFLENGKILYLGEEIALNLGLSPEAFYREKTPVLVNRLVEEWSFIMGVKPTKTSFRIAKKRWGSCSAKNELSFNLTLSQLPLELITYIVIHELSHINHKHHQKAFWQCVSEYMPNYKECEKELKKYSPAL